MSTLEQKIDIILECIASDNYVNEDIKQRAREALTRPSDGVDIRSNSDVDVDDMITDLFKELGISPNLIGYKYAFMAVKIALDDPSRLEQLFARVYTPVGTQYGTTTSCVERCIRTATLSMFEHVGFEDVTAILGNIVDTKSYAIKNGEFIASCVREINRRMKRAGKM